MFTRPTVHPHVHYYAPAPNRRSIKRCFCLTSVCLSRISGLSREQRGLGRPKLAAEVAHVTGNSDTTFKVKKSRSPGRFTHCRVGASGSCSGGRGNVLAVLLRCRLLGRARRGAHGERGEGRGHTVAPPAHSLILFAVFFQKRVPPVLAFDAGCVGFLTTLDFRCFQETINRVVNGTSLNMTYTHYFRFSSGSALYACLT